MSKGERNRYDGADEQLEELLSAHVTKAGFISYGEDMHQSRVEPTLIIAKKELVNSLFGLLQVSQLQLARVIETLHNKAKDDGASWTLPQDKVSTWAASSAKRIRVMMRHVKMAHGSESKKPPAWTKQLMLNGSGEIEEQVSDVPAESTAVWFTGWDHEMGVAFRALSTKPKHKEFSKTVTIAEGAAPTDGVLAVFGSDDEEHTIHEMTVEQYHAATGSKLAAVNTHKQKSKVSKCPHLWEAPNKSDGKLVHIVQKTNKNKGISKTLVVLYEGSRQLLQTIPSSYCMDVNDKKKWRLRSKS
jgi:hypothetical protein